MIINDIDVNSKTDQKKKNTVSCEIFFFFNFSFVVISVFWSKIDWDYYCAWAQSP